MSEKQTPPASSANLDQIDLEWDPKWPELARGRDSASVPTVHARAARVPITDAPSTAAPRDVMPTLTDEDPLRHDLPNLGRDAMPTLTDHDPLRHDVVESDVSDD